MVSSWMTSYVFRVMASDSAPSIEGQRSWEVSLYPGGRAAGVKLKRNPRRLGYIRAKKAVISNASLWDTQKLLPRDAISQKWSTEAQATSMTGSFMHLHLGVSLSRPFPLACRQSVVVLCLHT
jgi:hypothetical protein